MSSVAALPAAEESVEDWLPPGGAEDAGGYGATKIVCEALLHAAATDKVRTVPWWLMG